MATVSWTVSIGKACRPLASRLTPLSVAMTSTRSISLRTDIRWRLANWLVNRFSMEEVNRLGPDLACLQWLMNAGATSVTMSDGTKITSQREMRKFIVYVNNTHQPKRIMAPRTEVVSRHDALQRASITSDLAFNERWPNVAPVFIDEVDGTDAAITDCGFRYFRECFQMKKLKLNFCDYFGDVALAELAKGRPGRTLLDLEIVINPRLSDAMTYWLVQMQKLRRIHLYFLPYVVNREGVLRELRSSLPFCQTTFPDTIYIGYGYEGANKQINAYDRKMKKEFSRNIEKETM